MGMRMAHRPLYEDTRLTDKGLLAAGLVRQFSTKHLRNTLLTSSDK